MDALKAYLIDSLFEFFISNSLVCSKNQDPADALVTLYFNSPYSTRIDLKILFPVPFQTFHHIHLGHFTAKQKQGAEIADTNQDYRIK